MPFRHHCDLATRAAARASSCFCVTTRLGCCCADRSATGAVSAVTAAVSVPVSGGVGAGTGSLYVGSVPVSSFVCASDLFYCGIRKYYSESDVAAVDATPPPVRLWLNRFTRESTKSAASPSEIPLYRASWLMHLWRVALFIATRWSCVCFQLIQIVVNCNDSAPAMAKMSGRDAETW